MNTIKSIIIALLCVVLMAMEYFHKPQPDFDLISHRAQCKMKITLNRLQQVNDDIILIAKHVTMQEIDYRVHVREVQAAPAPAFIPPSYPPNLSPSFFVSARPCKSVAKGGF